MLFTLGKVHTMPDKDKEMPWLLFPYYAFCILYQKPCEEERQVADMI